MSELTEESLRVAETAVELTRKNRTAALILAAGNSTRMGKVGSKQFLPLNGIPVLARTMLAYEKCPLILEIIVAGRKSELKQIIALANQYKITKLIKVVEGGSDRAESARRALNEISKDIRFIAVADGARCLTTPTEIARVCLCAYQNKAASAACRVTDTVKRTGTLGNVLETVDRENLWTVQTPQVFHVALYAAATVRAKADEFHPTDDNAIIEHYGYGVRLIECSRENIKITTPEDLRLAKAILDLREQDAAHE